MSPRSGLVGAGGPGDTWRAGYPCVAAVATVAALADHPGDVAADTAGATDTARSAASDTGRASGAAGAAVTTGIELTA